MTVAEGVPFDWNWSRSERVVQRFCHLVSGRDRSELSELLTSDAVYHNIGWRPSTGREAVLDELDRQWSLFGDRYEFHIRHMASAGARVFVERIDITGGEHPLLHVPVVGVFRVQEGRISEWRDYWDSRLIQRIADGEDVSNRVPFDGAAVEALVDDRERMQAGSKAWP